MKKKKKKSTTLGLRSQKVFGALGDEQGSMKSSSPQCIPVLLKLEFACESYESP